MQKLESNYKFAIITIIIKNKYVKYVKRIILCLQEFISYV